MQTMQGRTLQAKEMNFNTMQGNPLQHKVGKESAIERVTQSNTQLRSKLGHVSQPHLIVGSFACGFV